MRTMLGILAFIAILVSCMMLDTPVSIFIDLPSLLIVIGTTMTLTVSRHDWDEIKNLSSEVVLSMINFSLVGGGIGFVVGLIQSFQKISDPSTIGPSIALSMLSILYSLILSAVLYAYKKKINSRRIGIAGITGGVAALIPVVVSLVALSL